FNSLFSVFFLFGVKQNSGPYLGCPSRSTNSMHIIFGESGRVKIYYVTNLVQIQTTRHNISRYKDSGLFGIKVFYGTDSVILGFVGMDYGHFTSEEFIQKIKNHIGVFFIGNKNKRFSENLFVL